MKKISLFIILAIASFNLFAQINSTDTLFVTDNANTPLYIATLGKVKSITVGNSEDYIYQVSPQDENVAMFLATGKSSPTSILIKYMLAEGKNGFYSCLIAYKEKPELFFKDLRMVSRTHTANSLNVQRSESFEDVSSIEDTLGQIKDDLSEITSKNEYEALIEESKSANRMFYSVGEKDASFLIQLENLVFDEKYTCAKIRVKNLSTIKYNVRNIDIVHIGSQSDRFYQRKRLLDILHLDVPAEIEPKDRGEDEIELILVFSSQFLETTDKSSSLFFRLQFGRKKRSIELPGRQILKIF